MDAISTIGAIVLVLLAIVFLHHRKIRKMSDDVNDLQFDHEVMSDDINMIRRDFIKNKENKKA